MIKPRISLIIPAYNEEKYIGTCLDCVIKNSNSNFFEIIVVDNASSDKTRQEAEKRKGIKVVYEKQKGLTYARQRGFMEASGDILAYLDADTQMPKNWCETVLEEFENNHNLACLSGPYIYYDIPKYQQFLVKTYWYLGAMPAYLIVGYMAVGGNFAIRKNILEKMKGFDTSIEFYGEDTNIARRANEFGKVKFKPSFAMYTSGRRLSGQGVLKTTGLYVLNFISEAALRRPITKKYKDIR